MNQIKIEQEHLRLLRALENGAASTLGLMSETGLKERTVLKTIKECVALKAALYGTAERGRRYFTLTAEGKKILLEHNA